jgi:hypothetical protein
MQYNQTYQQKAYGRREIYIVDFLFEEVITQYYLFFLFRVPDVEFRFMGA